MKNKPKKTKAIVTGSNELGLSIIKGLGKKKIPIIALYYDEEDVGQYSKYVENKVKSPSPRTNPDEFLRFLIKQGKEWQGSFLIPNGDDALELLSKNKKVLSKYYVVAVNDWKVTGVFLEKKLTYALAKKAGVPFPETLYPDSIKFLEKHKKEFVYPCILKPLESHKFYKIYKQKMFRVKDFNELKARFKHIHKNNLKVMICEIIPGRDHDSLFHFSCYRHSDGEFVANMCRQKLRQNPPSFGVARVVKTIPMISELRKYSHSMLRKAGYYGPCQCEFKNDPRTSKFKLIEVNGRISLPDTLLQKAGMNFPYMFYMDLVENKKIRVKDYKKDLYWIDFFTDFSNTLLRHNQESYLTLKDYLRPYFKKKVFAVLDFKGLKPFIMKVLLKFRKLFRILLGETKIRRKVY